MNKFGLGIMNGIQLNWPSKGQNLLLEELRFGDLGENPKQTERPLFISVDFPLPS